MNIHYHIDTVLSKRSFGFQSPFQLETQETRNVDTLPLKHQYWKSSETYTTTTDMTPVSLNLVIC